jgi:hypothetical protein
MLLFNILLKVLVYISIALGSETTVRTVPAIMASFNLIPGLKPSIPHSEQLPFTENEANVYLTRSIEQCLSDHYIFVQIPGLKVEDFQNFTVWPNFRNRLIEASTILSMPNIIKSSDDNDIINWKHLDSVLETECRVVKYTVNDMNHDEVPKIIHTNKVLIEVNVFEELVYETDIANRESFLMEIDELIRNICKKLPTRKISVILGGTTSNEIDLEIINNKNDVIEYSEIPDDPKVLSVELREKVKSSKSFIFPDITVFDKRRYFEYEKNDTGNRKRLSDLKDKEWAKDAEKNPDIPQEDDTWLKKKEKVIKKEDNLYKFGENEDFQSVFDNRQFIIDNALIIACGASLFVVFLAFDFIKLAFTFLKSFLKAKPAKKKTEKTE